MGSLLGGWQMNAIVVAQSGLPVGTTAGAELVGDPALENPTLARWFNTCTRDARRRPSELRVGGRTRRLAHPGAVHASDPDDAPRGRTDGAGRR